MVNERNEEMHGVREDRRLDSEDVFEALRETDTEEEFKELLGIEISLDDEEEEDAEGTSLTEVTEPSESARLCYVENQTAYFTTQSLDEQWGDDWNDAPYEHNAGTPYDARREGDDWEVYAVKFDTYFRTPREGFRNSPYSVEDINREKDIPWLRSETWDDRNLKVWAGATFERFREVVEESGGRVYLPVICD